MKTKTNPYIEAAMLEAVDNQLRDLNPPETKETYDRLAADGISDDRARHLIAAVLLTELNEMIKTQENYNPKRYISFLRKLPRLPWE